MDKETSRHCTITMQDLLSQINYIAVGARLRGLDNPNLDIKRLKERKIRYYLVTKTHFKEMMRYNSVKKYVSGFYLKDCSEIIDKHRNFINDRLKKNNNKSINNDPIYKSTKRTFHRNFIAKKYWIRMGCPKFGKQIISGVVWGLGFETTNRKLGWYRVIHKRYVGVRAYKKNNNHVGLNFHNAY